MLWREILDTIVSYGFKAIKWAWANKDLLMSLGVSVFEFISSLWVK